MKKNLKIFFLSVLMISCGGGGGDGDSGGGDPPPAPTPPGNPSLTSPANNTVCETGTSISDTQSNVVFSWQASSATDSYDLEVKNYLCKTNTSSSTAFRGFGGNQGMMAIENIIDNISRFLNKDPSDVRKENFYGRNEKNITHYGMKINDNVIHDIFKNLLDKSNYKKRYQEIRNFNLKNKFKKKGIALTPVKFGISFTTIHLNQAGALVHVYTDGSDG